MVVVVMLIRIPLASRMSLTTRLTALVLIGGLVYATLTWRLNKDGIGNN